MDQAKYPVEEKSSLTKHPLCSQKKRGGWGNLRQQRHLELALHLADGEGLV